MTDVADASIASSGWDSGASGRFLSLAVGRAVAQALGMAWFLVAARLLDGRSFGMIATGLAFFAIFAGLGDLGTTRSVVRYVAADERTMWSAYRKAMGLRISGGLVVGMPVAGAVALLPIPVSGVVVLLAALMAAASGATELAYAALRSVGLTRIEVALLIGERALFLAAGWAVVAAGGGPFLVLGLYLMTNLLSAVIGGAAVRRVQPADVVEAGSMTDREARFTAAGFGLVTVTPRIPSVLVAVFASATAVASFAVAQRPIEALTLFALSTCAPALPIIRSRVTRNRYAEAEAVATAIAGALLAVLTPLAAWFVVAPHTLLSLLFGGDNYGSAALVLQVLAISSLTWALRGVGEFVLLAEERARDLFILTSIGTLLTVIVGIPLVIHGAQTGAAATVLIAELVMTVVLLVQVPGLRRRAALRSYAPAVMMMAATSVALVPLRRSIVGACGVVLVSTAVAAVIAFRRIRTIEESP